MSELTIDEAEMIDRAIDNYCEMSAADLADLKRRFRNILLSLANNHISASLS